MFFKTVNNFLELITCHDDLKAFYNQLRNLHEKHTPVHGFVTVIKNEGRADEQVIQVDVENLLTNTGKDFFHNQVYINTTAGTRAANIIALSADATNPVVGDTTLVGEITTNGLARAVGTTGRVPASSLTTIEKVFTATAVFVNIHKSALFNQTTIGTPPTDRITHAREFNADVSLQISDTVTVTWSCTLG